MVRDGYPFFSGNACCKDFNIDKVQKIELIVMEDIPFVTAM